METARPIHAALVSADFIRILLAGRERTRYRAVRLAVSYHTGGFGKGYTKQRRPKKAPKAWA
ncbi:hypothetical protein SBA4_2650005 [Candidatus Sulfopaludibacter sp. SbA4]|nr:hypothetical protein SBA4_2650005 [Candidatus Sulfopaludibacter sp. SbA4]